MPVINDNGRRTGLSVLKDKKVVEHNDLITSVAKMDKIPLKIFELAVSHIDTANPPLDHIVKLSKKSLFAFFNVSDNDKHSRFKEAIERMQKQAYFVIKKEEERGVYFESIVPIPYVRWNDYDDEVIIRFDQAIMPYLIDLKTNFTQYAIADIMDLNSKYSIILYKWLSMNYNQYEHYEFSNMRTKSQLESYKSPQITMKELRSMTDTETEYKRFESFDRRVLKTALEEINKHTHFNVSYRKIKSGRSIRAIQFDIRKKTIAPNTFYKQEEKDPVYIEDKAVKEQVQKDNYLAAQQSPYTKILLSTGLLDFSDVLNMDTMLELAKFVYPLYDELSTLRKMTEVERHLVYVKDHQEGYSKQNKSKYLRVSIEDYLDTVKFQENLKK